jgi:hypothetical protein
MPEFNYNIDGWVDIPDEVDAVESEVGVFGSAASFLTGTGKGKIVLLYGSYDKIGLEFPYVDQGNIGSCVGAATTEIVDALKATEIASGEREKFQAQTAIEPIYYGARVVIGGNRLSGDGAVVAHAIKYIATYGVLSKIKYGQIDLTNYSVDRCRRWGNGKDFPKTLESISKENTVGAYSRVKSWEELRDSIANGHPVIVGSKYGFSSETDDEGFCKYSTTWNHAMAILGVDDDSKRKSGLISNTWGRNWLKIRKRKLGQPDGSFWVDAETLDAMMKNGDAWSVASFNGYRKPVNTNVSW